MRRLFVGCAIFTLGLFLAACELRAEISVNDDGSGTMGVTFAVEPEYLAMIPESGPDPFADMKADLKDDPVPWKVEDIREGNLRGIHAMFPFSSAEDLERKVKELGREESSSTGVEEFTLARDGSGWRFEGRSTDIQEETGNDFPIPAEQLAKLLQLQFRVTLPGKAASHNADETTSSGGRTTFIWKPGPDDRSVSFLARTTPGGGGEFPVLPVALIAAVVGVAIVVGILRSRRPVPVPAVPAQDVEALTPTDQNSP